ncbi:MAG: putative esterase of the alpha-beta hydrolase superfamily [Candidatus Acidoferrum typicum]|nr:putative esterase of the alpha-beta hydrolase superfamily [Candidatus Acidoferrum typicum]
MRRVFSLLALLVLPIFAAAQEPPAPQEVPRTAPKRRLKIGLALEGGGALGLAHIGVLQWFEEQHVPVDYIAGTSMGGLVGGFYAAGVSPADMKNLIERLDWDAILRDRTPYQDLSFLRKQDQRAYPNSLVLGLRKGLYLPAGLNAGHQIGLLIDREMLPYFGLSSFDALPVPFRCVATDLVSAKQFVFKNGSLAEALRATMSIPGAFTPVHDGQRVYVDGGLVNNLPTDVVRQMGADIVIAVHLETQPTDANEIQSLLTVLEQSVRAVISESEVRGLANADAVVSVPLGHFLMRDFTKNGPIMQSGYEAAKAKSKLLAAFALDDNGWNEYLHERDSRKQTSTAVPQFIDVQGTSAPAQEDIRRYLKNFLGKPLNADSLDPALTQLTGSGRYDTLNYRIVERGGKQGLLIIVKEKDFAPPTLQPAFEVDGSEAGDIEFTLGTRLTLMDVAGFRSEWRTDFLFGNTYGVASELYRPFRAESKWFVAPHASASDTTFQIYAENDPLADYRFYRTSIGTDLGYGFSRFSEVRVGYEVGTLSTKLRLGTLEIPAVDGRTGAARMRYLMDHTDDPVIPRRGFRVESNFRWFDTSPGATSAFPVLDTKVDFFQPVSRVASFFLSSEGGSTFGSRNTGVPQFFLGGAPRLSAYGVNELFGNQYYLFRGGYLHEIVSLPPFVGKKVYAIGSYEAGKMYGALNESKFPNDFAAGVLAETALGPFFVGGSVGDSGHHKWFFQLGRVF